MPRSEFAERVKDAMARQRGAICTLCRANAPCHGCLAKQKRLATYSTSVCVY